MNMKILPLVLFALCCSCSAEPEYEPPTCVGANGSSCVYYDDPTIAARCTDGICYPFGCDDCPSIPCRKNECINFVCRWFPVENGTSCEWPPGNVGMCIDDACQTTNP